MKTGYNTHCEKCNLLVAPNDPHQIRMGKKVFHESCFKKHIQETHGSTLCIQEVPEDEILAGIHLNRGG